MTPSFPTRRSSGFLYRRPGTGVESIAYRDTDGAEQPFTDFTINLATGRFYASQWPAIGRNGYATVTYTAGYAPEEVPVALVQAMLLLIGHSFSNREAVSVGNTGSEIP